MINVSKVSEVSKVSKVSKADERKLFDADEFFLADFYDLT